MSYIRVAWICALLPALAGTSANAADSVRALPGVFNGAPSASTTVTPTSLRSVLGGVPAYAQEMNVSTFARQYAAFDVTSPASSVAIGSAAPGTATSGTFVGDDFSRQYLLTQEDMLIAVSTDNGSLSIIGGAAPTLENEFWTGLKWDHTTDTLFASACSVVIGEGCHLYSVNPVTAAVTPVAPIGDASADWFPLDLAIDSSGQIYAINIVEPYDNYLTRIDKVTGAVTVIGPTGINAAYLQGTDFDKSTDTLYWAAFGPLGTGGTFQGRMYTVDTGNGSVTDLGALPNGGSEIWALSIARSAPAAIGAPAYAMEMNVSTFARQYAALDATAATTSVQIGPAPPTNPVSATFVGNDFSRQFAVTDDNLLITLSTTNGSLSVLGSAAPTLKSEYWTGLKWDHTTDTLFASACSVVVGEGCHLYSINPVTAAVTPVAPIGGASADWFPLDLAIDSAGQIYAVNIVEPYDNYLTRIDKTSGAVTVVGPTGINAMYLQGMDFDKSNDTLYWAAFGQLGSGGAYQGQMYTVDTSSGALTHLGALPNGGSEVWAFSVAKPAAAASDVIFRNGFD